MGYNPKHAIVRVYKGMSKKAKVSVVGGVAVLGLAAGIAPSFASTTPAVPVITSTAFTPYYTASVGHVALTTSVDGATSTATINANDTVTLESDSTSGAYAQANLAVPVGSALPAEVPGFVPSATPAGTGDPRFVITLANGDMLDNDQTDTVADDSSATAADWEFYNGTAWSSAETYSAAVTSAAAVADHSVSSVYIVVDASAANTPITLSDIEYAGAVMRVQKSTPHLTQGHIVTVDNNRAELGWTYNGYGTDDECAFTRTFGFDMTAADGTPHYGFTCSNAAVAPAGTGIGYWGGLGAGHTYDIEYLPATVINGVRTLIKGAPVGWINVVTTK